MSRMIQIELRSIDAIFNRRSTLYCVILVQSMTFLVMSTHTLAKQLSSVEGKIIYYFDPILTAMYGVFFLPEKYI